MNWHDAGDIIKQRMYMAVIDKISKSLQKIFGSRNERVLKKYWRMVEQVNAVRISTAR